MAVDRDRYSKTYYAKHELNQWRCSRCRVGSIWLVPDTLRTRHTADSYQKVAHSENPDDMEHRFVAILACNRCTESYSIAGVDVQEPTFEPEGPSMETLYGITHFEPAPDLFDIPKDLPADLRKMLRPIFSLFWANEPACANAIRSFIEDFLTRKCVKLTRINSKRRRVYLSLHERIVEYRTINQDQAHQLMAVKWIGNAGSHLEKIKRVDLLDAFELLEHVLAEEYRLKLAAERRRLATKINRRKGPILRTKRQKRYKPMVFAPSRT
jgi:hypothetical protein